MDLSCWESLDSRKILMFCFHPPMVTTPVVCMCGFHPPVVTTHVVSTLLWFAHLVVCMCSFHPPVVCTLLWLSHFCHFHPPMVCTLSWLPNYVMPMLWSKLRKLWAIKYFWVLLHVLITIFYNLCSVTLVPSVHVSSCVICPYRKYD